VFEWFRRKKPAPLTGAPVVRRQKSYSAQSGYVYQYYFEGRRADDTGTEYVFDVTADRKNPFPVSVFLAESVVASWQQGHQRTITTTERYAVAKMALFQAFDERRGPSEMKEPIRVRPADVDTILETLGIE